ncbi:MAG: biotin transporter BioY [Brotaphodocola sp.]
MSESYQSKGPRHTAKNLTICGLFAALIAAGAFMKISIPVQPFPMHFTMQWFFVLMAGFLLGSRLAFSSVVTYLIIGLVGVPVFAAGGGPAYLIRPTFGFLLGFAFAAWAIGWLCERMKPAKLWTMMIPATVGLLIYYLMGALYFYFISNYVISMPVGWRVVLINCCLITIGEDFVLCLLAALVAVRLRPRICKMVES